MGAPGGAGASVTGTPEPVHRQTRDGHGRRRADLVADVQGLLRDYGYDIDPTGVPDSKTDSSSSPSSAIFGLNE